MEVKNNEKSQRLQIMLDEALKPIINRLETLEKEVDSVRKGQEEIKKMLEEK